MSGRELLALAPFWILAGTAVLVMLGIAVRRSLLFTAALSVIGSAAALITAWHSPGWAPGAAGQLLVVDTYARFFVGLFAAAGIFIMLLGYDYFRSYSGDREEFFLLVLLAVLGAAILASSRHFVSLFLGLEILSVALYALIPYPLEAKRGAEAGVKYLILASASAAVLLFGMAFVYADLGALDFGGAAAALQEGGPTPLTVLGLSLIFVGIGFKLAVVPFHMWTPDVYQGAPAPVAALVSTVSKGGAFALFFQLFTLVPAAGRASLVLVFSLISGASMFAGNLLALRQTRVKRILAYSSIAHLGYLLVAFLAGPGAGAEAASFYLTAYFVTMLAAFGAVGLLSGPGRDADELADYRGLFWRRPAAAAVLTAALLSLAGIPLTAGFLGKFYVAAAGVRASLWTLVIILIVNSALGLYYYLRIIVTLYAHPEPGPAEKTARHVSQPAAWLALGALVALLAWIGIFPSGLIRLVRLAVAALAGTGLS